MPKIPYKVSVVIPTYQRADFLRVTISGLLQQTLQNIEIIVADDGSTDHTPLVMSSFSDPRVRYLRRDHVGMPLILNDGFSVACGEYIMTCHDHDIYEKNLLQELADVLDRNPKAVYAHCGIVVVDSEGLQELASYIRNYPEVTSGKTFLTEVLLPGIDSKVSALTMVRASVLSRPPFNVKFGECSDVDLWMKLSAIGDVAYVPKPLIRVRQRDNSSELYRSGFRLAAHALEAKKSYLSWVEDQNKQHKIQIGWRKEIDRTGLLELLKALENRWYDEISPIILFVQREGTSLGGKALTLLSYLPRFFSLNVLRSMRIMSKAIRAVHTI